MQLRCARFVITSFALLLFGSLLAAQQTDAPAAGTEDSLNATSAGTENVDSHVRIVRLSEVTGTVSIDRDVGDGFEDALVNMPVTEGTMLSTGLGFAEVEFEDNSTLRLTPNSLVEFQRLELLPSGVKVSTVNVERGTVFVSLSRNTDQQFQLRFAHQETLLAPSTDVRLFLAGTSASLAVLNGSVQLDQPSGPLFVGKKKSILLDLRSIPQITVSKNVEGPYDQWNQQAIDYHNRLAKGSAFANAGSAYGTNDMDYYGSFVNTTCGALWRPYFATGVWDPFADGSWVWYSDWGYAWVSPYPWGWMPYHYGTWQYCQGYGWGWRRPIGAWGQFRPIPKPAPPPPGVSSRPRPPRHPEPGSRPPRVVPVNQKPPVTSGINSSTLVIRQDSAGLGVPRGAAGNLGHLDANLGQHGARSIAVNSPMAVTETRAALSPGSTAPSGRVAYSQAGGSSHSSSPSYSHSSTVSHSSSESSSGRGSTSSGSSSGGSNGRK